MASISEAYSIDALVQGLRARTPALKATFQSTKPFRYLVIDEALPTSFVRECVNEFPAPRSRDWDDKEYSHQLKKLTATKDFPPHIERFFALSASSVLRDWMTEVTGIEKLLADEDLVGGGLHQTVNGGFLDVHVDYNYHPMNKLHRRLNLLLFLNDGWQRSWGGCLELWDMANKRLLREIEPTFNRAVLFETNEVSFHGHPQALKAPEGISRRSLAVYYYTETRDDDVVAPEHNTIYKQTTGIAGYRKSLSASVYAARRHLRERGVVGLGHTLAKHALRLARNQPPENG